MFKLFNWDEKMSIDKDVIDDQHKTMMMSANLLFESLSKGKSKDVIIGGINCLRNYILEHFDYEIAYMKKHNYPALEEHLKSHEEFLNKYEEFLKRVKSKEVSGELAVEIYSFISNWFISHIENENIRYHDFWKNKEA